MATPNETNSGPSGESATLLHTALFKQVSSEEAEELLPHLQHAEYSKGDYIFREGDTDHRMYLLERGRVKLIRQSSDRRVQLLSIHAYGEVLGEIPVFDPHGGPRDISVARCIFRITRFTACDCAEKSDGNAFCRHTHQSHVRIVRGNRLQSSRNVACGRASLALQQVFPILQESAGILVIAVTTEIAVDPTLFHGLDGTCTFAEICWNVIRKPDGNPYEFAARLLIQPSAHQSWSSWPCPSRCQLDP